VVARAGIVYVPCERCGAIADGKGREILHVLEAHEPALRRVARARCFGGSFTANSNNYGVADE
jgi:uncharacterized C2H2 Zn-finger protein